MVCLLRRREAHWVAVFPFVELISAFRGDNSASRVGLGTVVLVLQYTSVTQ